MHGSMRVYIFNTCNIDCPTSVGHTPGEAFPMLLKSKTCRSAVDRSFLCVWTCQKQDHAEKQVKQHRVMHRTTQLPLHAGLGERGTNLGMALVLVLAVEVSPVSNRLVFFHIFQGFLNLHCLFCIFDLPAEKQH